MNKKDVFEEGYNAGYGIASVNISNDLCDNFTQEDLDKFISDCVDYESDGYRQFSPFEFFAHDLNSSSDPDYFWKAYEDGVYKGVCARVKEFKRGRTKKGQKLVKITQ